MPWDANIAATKFSGKLPLQSFNNLMGALRERCVGAGVSVPPVLQNDLEKLELLPKTFFSVFQTTITTLLTKYANHTDSAGNWDNKSSIPSWTESGILAPCDKNIRISAPSSLVCAEWCYQQYQILNLLRWVKHTLTLSNSSPADKKSAYSTSSWNDAVNSFNATNWGSDPVGLPMHYIGHGAINSLGDGGGNIWRCRGRGQYANNTIYDITTQHYFMFGKDGTYTKTYNNNDFPNAQENKLCCIETKDINAGDSYTYEVGNINNSSVSNPFHLIPSVYFCGWVNYGFESHLVLKFDGIGGFTYKNW